MEEFPGRVGLRRSFVRSMVVFAAALSPVGAGGQRRPAPPSWGRRRSRCGACQNFHRLRVERDADERRGRRRPRLEHRRPLTSPPLQNFAERGAAPSCAAMAGNAIVVRVRSRCAPPPRDPALGPEVLRGRSPWHPCPPPSPAPGPAAPAEGRGGPLARADETDTVASTGGGEDLDPWRSPAACTSVRTTDGTSPAKATEARRSPPRDRRSRTPPRQVPRAREKRPSTPAEPGDPPPPARALTDRRAPRPPSPPPSPRRSAPRAKGRA